MPAASSDPLERWHGLWQQVVARCLAGHAQITGFEIRFTTVGDSVHGDIRCFRGGEVIRHRGFGAPTSLPMPDCRDLLDELRAIEYHPDTGSFLTTTITGAGIGAFSARADPLQATAPSDEMHFDAADLRREARRFPRSTTPAWWIAVVEAADRQTDAFTARAHADPVAFTMSDSDSTPAVAAQRVAVVGAVAATVGSVAPVVSVDAKRIRTVYRTPSTGFTHHQRNDDVAVLSGYSAEHRLLDPASFAGVPEWVRIEHLDDSIRSGQLTFCVWYEDGSWHHTPDAGLDAMLQVINPLRSPTHAAYDMAYLVDPTAQPRTEHLDALFAACFELVSFANPRSLRPITTKQFSELMALHLPRRHQSEVDAALDLHAGWELLRSADLDADAGPDQIVDDLLRELQMTLGDNTVRVAVAAEHRLLNWSTPPGADTDNTINGLITRLRAQMFRRGRGSWWYAEFTNSTADFTATDERPPTLLPLTAYADDIAGNWSEPPVWLYRLWTAQSVTIAQGACDRAGAPTPVAGLDVFPTVAGRWAAIAGAIFGMASDAERSADELPIRADLNGLWCSSIEGYHLRLTPLSEGRAVLSGVHSPVETTDPISVVDGLPGWISPLDLHPAIDHSALTVCWWFEGTAWAASADAEFTDADHLPLPWVRSTEAAAAVIEQIATSSGLTPDPAAVHDFVATSERDPAAARAKMMALF